MVDTKVAKWGNSLAVRIPTAFADEARLKDGDTVEIAVRDGAIVISSHTPELRMAEVLLQITDENIHEGIDFGRAVGKEEL